MGNLSVTDILNGGSSISEFEVQYASLGGNNLTKCLCAEDVSSRETTDRQVDELSHTGQGLEVRHMGK